MAAAARISALTPFAFGLSLVLAGCTVGPTYRGAPDAAPVSQSRGSFRRGEAAQQAASATDLPAQPPARWWEALNDAELTRLVDLALARSPTLQAAQARILEARATLAKQRSALYPQGTGTGIAARAWLPGSTLSGLTGGGGSQASGGGSGASSGSSGASSAGGAGAASSGDAQSDAHTAFSLYSVGFDALWELDLFGGTRRGIESARARSEASAAQYEDAQVQLAAEVGQAYMALRGAQEQLALDRRSSELERQALALTQDRRRLGTASDLDVERMRAQAEQTEAAIPGLQGEVEQGLDRIALLTGQEPGTLDAELAPPHALPLPPAEVPIGDPAALLRRRPDIRAAERQLAASNAAIGQAVAAYFPSVTLVGNVGFSSGQTSDLFEHRNLGAVLAPVLRWNFLTFGSTRAQVRQAEAADAEALAQYRGAVLSALQDAEASLSRFGRQRESVLRYTLANDSAGRSAALAQLRYRGGTASLIDALDAERQRLQAEQGLSQAHMQLGNDYVALQKSLGLGWKPFDDSGEPQADGSGSGHPNAEVAKVSQKSQK